MFKYELSRLPVLSDGNDRVLHAVVSGCSQSRRNLYGQLETALEPGVLNDAVQTTRDIREESLPDVFDGSLGRQVAV